jgi:hypothetical protein
MTVHHQERGQSEATRHAKPSAAPQARSLVLSADTVRQLLKAVAPKPARALTDLHRGQLRRD